MARSSYDESLARLLVHEGGYSNHPADPGGPTNFGITLADARRYWKPHATAADVRDMPVEIAKQIYQAHYWAPMRCDELAAGVDYAVFDYGVNSGIGRAAKVLQRLVGVQSASQTRVNAQSASQTRVNALVLVDGQIGPITVAATSRGNPAELVNRICAERLAFLQGLSTWSVFGAGWGRRVREVKAAALAMAEKAAKSAPPPSPPTPPAPPAPPRPKVTPGAVATRSALVATVAGGAHWLGAHPLLVGGLLVVGLLLALYIPSNLKGGD